MPFLDALKKTRMTAGAVLGVLLVVGGLDTTLAGQEAAAEAAQKARQPEFRTKSASAAFERGLESFRKQKYREAYSSFRSAAGRAKTAADKKIVADWLVSAQGGMQLLIIQKEAAMMKLKDALFHALDLRDKYRGIPIEPQFELLVTDLAVKVLHEIEDFDRPSAEFSKKYGKTTVPADPKDPSVVYHGKGCLDWAQMPDKKAIQLRLRRNVPKSWNEFEGLVFWLYTYKPLEMEILVKTPSKGTKQIKDYLSTRFSPKVRGKWERIFIPLEKFQKRGKGTLSSVDSLMFHIRSLRDFHYRVDWVCLVRKGPKTATRKTR